MVEFFRLVFSSFWTFIGFFFLLALPCGAIANIGRSHCSKCETCENYEIKVNREESPSFD